MASLQHHMDATYSVSICSICKQKVSKVIYKKDKWRNAAYRKTSCMLHFAILLFVEHSSYLLCVEKPCIGRLSLYECLYLNYNVQAYDQPYRIRFE
jgi:hypothetical protein